MREVIEGMCGNQRTAAPLLPAAPGREGGGDLTPGRPGMAPDFSLFATSQVKRPDDRFGHLHPREEDAIIAEPRMMADLDADFGDRLSAGLPVVDRERAERHDRIKATFEERHVAAVR